MTIINSMLFQVLSTLIGNEVYSRALIGLEFGTDIGRNGITTVVA